jgi:hypothetical protein
MYIHVNSYTFRYIHTNAHDFILINMNSCVTGIPITLEGLTTL